MSFFAFFFNFANLEKSQEMLNKNRENIDQIIDNELSIMLFGSSMATIIETKYLLANIGEITMATIIILCRI